MATLVPTISDSQKMGGKKNEVVKLFSFKISSQKHHKQICIYPIGQDLVIWWSQSQECVVFIPGDTYPAIIWESNYYWGKGEEHHSLSKYLKAWPWNKCSFQNIPAVASSVSLFLGQILFESRCLWVIGRPWFFWLSVTWYLISGQHLCLRYIDKLETSNTP